MTEEQENGSSRQLRPRRSVLTDISNKIAGGLANVTGKATKKRKLSGANEAVGTTVEIIDNNETVKVTENPVASSESGSIESVESSVCEAQVEEDIEVFALNPNKIRRTFPLRTAGADPAQCLNILDSMYEIYYEQEEIYAAQPYMHTQEDLNNKMRSILVDWLVEVHHKFRLASTSLWLCVNIIDRFLMKVPIKRAKLQLVGISAFFIACKFEEVHPPEAKDFVHITDNAYTRQEMLLMESDILNALNYEILIPTGYNFLHRYLDSIRAGDNIRMLANYYAERNLQEAHMLEVKPRIFAAAAIYAALVQQSQRYATTSTATTTNNDTIIWNRILKEESNLTVEDILPCARLIIQHVREEPITTSKRKLNAAKKKYSLDKYLFVGKLDLPVL